MKYVHKTSYSGNKIRRIDYNFSIYVPIYNFRLGRAFVIDAMGGRYIRKRRTLALIINWWKVKFDIIRLAKAIINKKPLDKAK